MRRDQDKSLPAGGSVLLAWSRPWQARMRGHFCGRAAEGPARRRPKWPLRSISRPRAKRRSPLACATTPLPRIAATSCTSARRKSSVHIARPMTATGSFAAAPRALPAFRGHAMLALPRKEDDGFRRDFARAGVLRRPRTGAPFGDHHMNFKHVTGLFCAAAMFLALGSGAQAQDKVIKIGVIMPMSGGTASSVCTPRRRSKSPWTSSTTPILSLAICRWRRTPALPASAAPRSRLCSPTTRATRRRARTRRYA